MDGFIAVITVVLVVAYLAFAIYSIIESDTTGKRVGLTVAFAAGGCVSVTVASFVAVVLFWGVVVVAILAIVGFICSICG